MLTSKAKKTGKKTPAGFPRFTLKKISLGSFRLTGAIHVSEKVIHILSATVSERTGGWFVPVQVEMDQPEPLKTAKPVAGVDLGIMTLTTVSDGTRIENPRALPSSLLKIKRLQRVVSRRQRGSASRQKAVRQLAKAHLRVSNLCKNALHQTTSLLATLSPALAPALQVQMEPSRRLYWKP